MGEYTNGLLGSKAVGLLGAGKDFVLKHGKKLLKKAGELGSALLSPITAIPKLIEKWTTDQEATTETNEILEDILALLEDRLPGSVKGDLTGDGIVDNSVRDLIAKREARRKEKEEAQKASKNKPKEEGEKRGGIGGLLVTALGALSAKFDSATDWIKNIAQQFAAYRAAKLGADALGGAGDLVGGGRRTPRGKGGWLRRIASVGGRGLKSLGTRAGGWALRGLS